MNKRLLLLLPFLFGHAAAFADDQPAAEPKQRPSHIKFETYEIGKRYFIKGIVGMPTVITFPDDETLYRAPESGAVIKDEHSGDVLDGDWQEVEASQVKEKPLNNVVPIWAMRPGTSTMTIVMLVDGHQKIYPFELEAVARTDKALTNDDVTLNVIFGPGPKQAAPKAPQTSVSGAMVIKASPLVHRLTAAEKAEAEERIRTDAFNGRGDGECHYHAQGPQKAWEMIRPRCPMDNGIWTIIRFPGLNKKPAAYIVSGDGYKDERLAGQHESGDFVVIEEIAQRIRLRLGQDVMDIVNDAYDPAGKPTGTGTISPTVQRDVIQAKSK